jgi:hypothetical protein
MCVLAVPFSVALLENFVFTWNKVCYIMNILVEDPYKVDTFNIEPLKRCSMGRPDCAVFKTHLKGCF